MHQLIPSLATLVESFRDCFHPAVFATFQSLIAGWVVCLGPHTLSGVWQATGLAARRHHDTAYAVFHSAAWEWDDLGIVLATLILTHLVPGGVVWIAVDDTLCHKRGAKVAFGGIFLDAVLSSKKHKTFRFGLNWVVLGIAVPLPMRDDRYFCLPVLWRLYRKKEASRSQAPSSVRRRVGPEAGRGQSRPRPSGWSAIVPTSTRRCCKAAPSQPPGDRAVALEGGPVRPARTAARTGQRGRRRKKGERLPTPKAMIEDTATYPAELIEIAFPKDHPGVACPGDPRGALVSREQGPTRSMVVLVRDPSGQWRDEALVTTDPTCDGRVRDPPDIVGSWSVELGILRQQTTPGLARAEGAFGTSGAWSGRIRWRGSSAR